MSFSSERHESALFLVLLLAADLAFIGLEVLHVWGYANDPRFALGMERGYAEVFQYIKFFWIAFILSWFTLEKRQVLYGVGALLFVYLLLDDSLQVHERGGTALVDEMGIEAAFGLRAQDYGELVVSASAGLFFLLAGGLSYRYSDALARQIGLYLLMD